VGMMVYVFSVAILIFMLDRKTSRWKIYEELQEKQGPQSLKRRLTGGKCNDKLNKQIKQMGLVKYLCLYSVGICCPSARRSLRRYRETRYILIRQHFIRYHHLCNTDFKFYLYLQLCLEHELESLVSISLKICEYFTQNCTQHSFIFVWRLGLYILVPLVLSYVVGKFALNGGQVSGAQWWQAVVVSSVEDPYFTDNQAKWQQVSPSRTVIFVHR
jgi:hypothetical protein